MSEGNCHWSFGCLSDLILPLVRRAWSPLLPVRVERGYYGYKTGEFVCFSFPSVADSATRLLLAGLGAPRKSQADCRSRYRGCVFCIVWHEQKHCAAVDKGVTSILSCPLHLKNELKNGAWQMRYPSTTSSASLEQHWKALKIISQGGQWLSLLSEAYGGCTVWEAACLCVGNKAGESKAVSSLLAPCSCATEEFVVIHLKDPILCCLFYPWIGGTGVLAKAGYEWPSCPLRGAVMGCAVGKCTMHGQAGGQSCPWPLSEYGGEWS